MKLITKLYYVFRHRHNYMTIYAESLSVAKTLLRLRVGSDGYHKLQGTTYSKREAKRFRFWNRKTIKRIWTTTNPKEPSCQNSK